MLQNSFDHVAFATNDTDKSVEVFSVLGFDKTLFHKKSMEKFGSYITKLESQTGQIIELVEPETEQSVVKKLLGSCDASIYHSAFYSKNLMETLKKLKALGAILVTEPQSIPYPATPLHEHYHTSHVFHPNVGLFEVTGPIIGESK